MFIHYTKVTKIVQCSISALLALSFLSGCGTSGKKQPDPYKGMAAEQMYQQGKEAAKNKKYAAAIKDFEELESRFPYGEYTDKAQLALIHAYYEQDNSASSLAIADRFIRVHPRHQHVDYAYYMKGFVNYKENFSTVYRYFPIERSMRDPSLAQQAFDDFKNLLQRFPQSKYAPDAKKRMAHLRNQLAEYELDVANYYISQKAYLAAANRAGYILNYFDQSTSVPDALMIMVRSYRAMGMHDLAEDALATMQYNFPDLTAKSGLLVAAK